MLKAHEITGGRPDFLVEHFYQEAMRWGAQADTYSTEMRRNLCGTDQRTLDLSLVHTVHNRDQLYIASVQSALDDQTEKTMARYEARYVPSKSIPGMFNIFSLDGYIEKYDKHEDTDTLYPDLWLPDHIENAILNAAVTNDKAPDLLKLTDPRDIDTTPSDTSQTFDREAKVARFLEGINTGLLVELEMFELKYMSQTSRVDRSESLNVQVDIPSALDENAIRSDKLCSMGIEHGRIGTIEEIFVSYEGLLMCAQAKPPHRPAHPDDVRSLLQRFSAELDNHIPKAFRQVF